MKSVLVTGGAGFIGSHLTEALLDHGYKVRILDNLSYGRKDWIDPRADFILGDVVDPDICKKACDGINGVFHAAAMSRAGPSTTAAQFCIEQNIIGTQNMLSASVNAGVTRFVYSGSSTYYGNQLGRQTEDQKPDTLNFYAMSKFAGEELVRLTGEVYDMDCLSLRYFNVYGPRQPQSGTYALVLGIFLDRWARGKPLEIHGSGHQRRDFVHVRDVALANIAAFESEITSGVFNVGTGHNISIKELADMISENQIYAPRRAGDAEITLADIHRASKLLNWQAKINFEDGLRELMDISLSSSK